jgi:S-adenosylmethionine-diacylgycerolhomoserine-N-methlytransferase
MSPIWRRDKSGVAMSLAGELKTLYHLTVSPVRGQTHAERLESFYSRQAADYDAFRKHLLHGREELYRLLPVPCGGIWVEMGGGTGHNLEYLGQRLGELRRVYVVDLADALLAVARNRAARHGWANVETVATDVGRFEPAEGEADVVVFSYSLTMIPDWFAALDQALRILKPGGTIGVVDFYVSRKYPAPSRRRHGWLTRSFWPLWLGLDNVHPSPDHVPYLFERFEPVHYFERATRMRYFPLLQVPYYLFLGRKPR